MNDKMLKLVDGVIFLALWAIAYHYYTRYTTMQNITDALIFDAVNIAALIIVMLRRQNVNTVSLAAMLLVGRCLDVLIFQNMGELSGWIVYPVLILFNVVAIFLVWTRPVWASKIKESNNYAITNQDLCMVLLFCAQGLFMGLMLIEFAARKMGFDVTVIYTHFEITQFSFTVCGVAILYFMTFNVANLNRESLDLKAANNNHH